MTQGTEEEQYPQSTVSVEDALNSNSQLAEPLLPNNNDHENDHNDTSDVDRDDDNTSPPAFKGLLFYRSIYFLNGLSASTWGRFGIVYYNRVKHLNPGHIGVLQGVTPLLSFVSQPAWGWVSDRIQSRKQVYVVCKGCSTVLLLSLSLKAMASFWSILAVICGMACFRSGGVLDAHTLDFLGETHRGMYGSIRLWTAISWGLGAVIMGWITDNLGFEWNFGLFGSMMLLTLLAVVFGLPARSKSEQECYERWNNHAEETPDDTDNNNNNGHDASGPRVEVLKDALLRLPVIFWLLEVSIIGAGMAIVDSFLFVYLQNDLKATTELCGYTVGATVLLELPVFHFSKLLLSKLGHDVLFLFSMVAYSTRVVGYTFLTPETVYWVLLLEFSHGITFACMWIASIDYAAAIAPKEWSTTVQSALSTALTCVGGALGPVLGGLVMDRFGAVFMFRGIAIIVASILMLHLIALLMFKKGHDKFLRLVQEERRANRGHGEASSETADEEGQGGEQE